MLTSDVHSSDDLTAVFSKLHASNTHKKLLTCRFYNILKMFELNSFHFCVCKFKLEHKNTLSSVIT